MNRALREHSSLEAGDLRLEGSRLLWLQAGDLRLEGPRLLWLQAGGLRLEGPRLLWLEAGGLRLEGPMPTRNLTSKRPNQSVQHLGCFDGLFCERSMDFLGRAHTGFQNSSLQSPVSSLNRRKE